MGLIQYASIKAAIHSTRQRSEPLCSGERETFEKSFIAARDRVESSPPIVKNVFLYGTAKKKILTIRVDGTKAAGGGFCLHNNVVAAQFGLYDQFYLIKRRLA